jgi:hypothetical protein
MHTSARNGLVVLILIGGFLSSNLRPAMAHSCGMLGEGAPLNPGLLFARVPTKISQFEHHSKDQTSALITFSNQLANTQGSMAVMIDGVAHCYPFAWDSKVANGKLTSNLSIVWSTTTQPDLEDSTVFKKIQGQIVVIRPDFNPF